MLRRMTSFLLAIVLLAACGGTQTATTPTTAPAEPTIAAEAPTTAPTEAAESTVAVAATPEATEQTSATETTTDVTTTAAADATTAATADTTAAPDATAGTAADGVFPVTIEHKHGSTTINQAPQRVLAVGLSEQDTLIALGIAPIAVTYWFGEEDGIGVWAQEAFDKLGAPTPVVLNDPAGISFERITELKPDLILALYSNVSAEEYALLTQIAPTIAQPNGYVNYGLPWQVMTRTVGQAVGKAGTAEVMVAEVEARFQQERDANPELVGVSMIAASPYQGIGIYSSEDPRSRIFEALGPEIPASFDSLFGDSFYAVVSLEEAALLDLDLVIWISADSADASQRLGGPVYETLKVHKEGREAFINNDDNGLYEAISFASVLSIPYTLDALVPRMVAAVDGDPATADTGAPASLRDAPADATTTNTTTAD